MTLKILRRSSWEESLEKKRGRRRGKGKSEKIKWKLKNKEHLSTFSELLKSRVFSICRAFFLRPFFEFS